MLGGNTSITVYTTPVNTVLVPLKEEAQYFRHMLTAWIQQRSRPGQRWNKLARSPISNDEKRNGGGTNHSPQNTISILYYNKTRSSSRFAMDLFRVHNFVTKKEKDKTYFYGCSAMLHGPCMSYLFKIFSAEVE